MDMVCAGDESNEPPLRDKFFFIGAPVQPCNDRWMLHRIRIQFRLRTLLLAVTMGCVAFGVFGVLLQRVRSQ
jgi:hypothetical protein